MNTPIKMILHCPACGLQHIDAPTGEHSPGCNITCGMPASGCSCKKWDNPPHRSHLCAGCGHIWRPADVCTEGVQSIETRGANDSPTARPSAIFPEFRNLLSVEPYSDMSAIVTFVACRPAGQFVKDLRNRLLWRKL